MDFFRAGRSHHPHDLLRGRATHQGIVDENHAPAVQHAPHWIELHFHPEMSNGGLRLNEGPAHIVVADETHAERHARLLGKTHGGTDAGVRHRDNDIGVNRLFARQNAAQLRANLVDAAAEDIAVGAREVHVLEDAVRERRGRIRLDRLHAVGRHNQHFARLYIAFVSGADEIHRARFRADHPGIVEPAERERTESVRIAHRHQAIAREHHEGKCSLHLRDRLDNRVLDGSRFGARVQVQDDFGVAARLEYRSL